MQTTCGARVFFGFLTTMVGLYTSLGDTQCNKDGTLEVVEHRPANVFTCNGLYFRRLQSRSIKWGIQVVDRTSLTIATCPPPPGICQNQYELRFQASRPAFNLSTLNVNGSNKEDLEYIRGRNISCSTLFDDRYPTRCRVDVVAVPSVTCDGRYSTETTSPRTVTVNCKVSGAYSYLHRYTCELLQVVPNAKSLGSANVSLTPGSGKHKEGGCQVTVPHPSSTSVHDYKMVVTPGWVEATVSFGNVNSFVIPTTPAHSDTSDLPAASRDNGTRDTPTTPREKGTSETATTPRSSDMGCEETSDLPVALIVSIVLLVALILTNIGFILWLRRRQWMMPFADSGQTKSSTDVSTQMSPQQRIEPAVQMSAIIEDPDRIYEEAREPYDELRPIDIALRSVYTGMAHYTEASSTDDAARVNQPGERGPAVPERDQDYSEISDQQF